MENAKESWWKQTKNHLKITKLVWKFGDWKIKSDIEKILDLNVKETLKFRLEDILSEDKRFNGDDGSTQNLIKYENLVNKLLELKQEVEKKLKVQIEIAEKIAQPEK